MVGQRNEWTFGWRDGGWIGGGINREMGGQLDGEVGGEMRRNGWIVR